ncbi:hypothetical protein HZA99_03590 [Candidatus Woesearchaeota archaeon]|nr:hypothetical protein [Candidatus Woesearchaeota archaeon]
MKQQKKQQERQRSINQKNKLYRCSICHFQYKTKAWAEKCEQWCKIHKSCNMDITKYAIIK